MEALKEKILTEGQAIGTEIVKVDGFLNHQIDVKFLEEIGEEFKRRFSDLQVDKILTVEASGIAIACMCAPLFGYPPVVFAKKAAPSTMNEGFYEAEARSFTKGTVSKLKVAEKFVNEGEKILIIDDFLANGAALKGLIELCRQAGAEVIGAGICIEKAFQPGGDLIRSMGVRVESLARVKSMSVENGVEFC